MTTTDGDVRFLRSLTLRNLLSYGPDSEPIELRNLNVLIGPNGSGKTNLIEAISLLRAAAVKDHLLDAIRIGGGVGEWIWKGHPRESASIDAIVAYPRGHQNLRHLFAFRADTYGLRVATERIEGVSSVPGAPRTSMFYDFSNGRLIINAGPDKRGLPVGSIDLDASILDQRRDPDLYPEITYLGQTYQRIRIYRQWTFGNAAVFRGTRPADERNDRLVENFSNLGLFLSKLRRSPKTKDRLLVALKDIYDGIRDFEVLVEAGGVQVFFTEGDFSIPATRLSDGTLRYLCLLAILCDPDPPPLICIEEPELGLHPDLLPKIADLLFLAAERTQLIVTTHSDVLVDAMSERPEDVVVCEKHDGQTVLRRLEPDRLAKWLADYRLGQLWSQGQIGGNRW